MPSGLAGWEGCLLEMIDFRSDKPHNFHYGSQVLVIQLDSFSTTSKHMAPFSQICQKAQNVMRFMLMLCPVAYELTSTKV